MHTPAATLNATFFLMTDQRGTDRTAQPTWAQPQVSSTAPGQRVAYVCAPR